MVGIHVNRGYRPSPVRQTENVSGTTVGRWRLGAAATCHDHTLCNSKIALPGLDPGIHVLRTCMAEPKEGVDGRITSGHSDITRIAIPTKVGTHVNRGYRPSPVRQRRNVSGTTVRPRRPGAAAHFSAPPAPLAFTGEWRRAVGFRYAGNRIL